MVQSDYVVERLRELHSRIVETAANQWFTIKGEAYIECGSMIEDLIMEIEHEDEV